MSTRSLKIWLPSIKAGSGGDVFVERLAGALARVGHDPIVQWFDHRYELAPWLLRRFAPPSGVDLVHANSWQAFAFKHGPLPLVVTEHHYILDPDFRSHKSWLQHAYHRAMVGPGIRRSFRVADAVTTDTRFTAEVIARNEGVDSAHVIPLWADYDQFAPGPGAAYETSPHTFRLLFVGNASRRKGADVIAPLAQRLGNSFEIKCTAGLRDTHVTAGVTNIKILGRLSQQELIDEYRACDAVLVPSRYEGFGYAALEAMACGKPVVGFSCGAVDEVVSHGDTALLCPVDDLDTLVKHCKQLASDRALASRMGENGRRRAVSVFSEENAVRKYVEVYEAVLDGQRTRGVGVN